MNPASEPEANARLVAYPPTRQSAPYILLGIVLGVLGLAAIGAITFVVMPQQRYALVPAQSTPFVWKLDQRTGRLQYCRFDAKDVWCVNEHILRAGSGTAGFSDDDLWPPTPTRGPSEVPQSAK
jgi:hypothetical protein